MGKTIVFSWKIDGNKYGYLYSPDSNDPVICDRITDSAILSNISTEVSSWNESKYSSKFSSLNNKIRQYTNGIGIPGSYADYYMKGDKNYIVLTGKDGGGVENNSGNCISEDVINKLKRYIDAKFEATKTDLQGEIVTAKNTIYESFESVKQQIDDKVSVATDTLALKYDSEFEKLSGMTEYVDTASKIFKLSSNEVLNADEISRAIFKVEQLSGDAITTATKLSQFEEKSTVNTAQIDTLQGSYNEVTLRVNEVESGLTAKINQLSEDVSSVETKIERIKQQSYSSMEAEESQYLSAPAPKGGNNEDFSYVSETETIDNGDGTFNIDTTIGDETFKIKIYGYGRKIKATDKEEGLVLANNGFKYFDKSGSFISMVNGNIRLSNSDCSGKLEIKKDGLYINGVKQWCCF